MDEYAQAMQELVAATAPKDTGKTDPADIVWLD